jgi:hypothetical protein
VNGEPVIYNGLYSTCINGGYYLDQGMKILAEALERYEVDGLFFNMFGNQSRDYSGLFVGHCHRDSCRTKYRALYGKELPAEPDEQYRQFMFQSSREVAAEIGKLIRSKRPNAGTSTTYRSTRTACRSRTRQSVVPCRCGRIHPATMSMVRGTASPGRCRST